MESLRELVETLGSWLAQYVPFVPDFPYRGTVFVFSAVSITIGILLSFWFLARVLFQRTSTREKLELAEELARKGNHEEAKRVFVSVKAYAQAAKMALKLGEKNEAADLAFLGGDFALAGQLFASLNRHAEAAQANESAGKFLEAGEQWEKIHELEQALACYRKAKSTLRMESVLLRLKRWGELGDLLAEEFSRVFSLLGPHPSSEAMERVQALGAGASDAYKRADRFEKAAEIHLHLGQYSQAAECVERGGGLVRAADLYQQGGKLEEAARLLIRAGRYEMAADLYEQLHEPEKVPELLEKAGKLKEARLFAARLLLHHQGDPKRAGDLYAEAGEFQEAAGCYQNAGEWSRAGECWRQVGSTAAAAEAFVKSERWLEAAEEFVKAEKYDRAGACFEKGGKIDRAVEEYERGEKFFEAARLAEPLDADRAIGLYQRVAPLEKESWRAEHALGRIFVNKKLLELASEKYQKLHKKIVLSKRTLDFFYDYGTYLEAVNNWKEADEVYARILTIDFHYRDALARKKALEPKLQASPVAFEERVTVASAQPPRSFSMEPGERVADRYELTRKIGGGGMGIVFLGRDRKLDRDVAVKFLPPAGNPELEQRFLREARIVAQLSHPNIVAVYDMGNVGGHLFLVMEYVDGPNLKEFLEERKRLSIPLVVHLVRQTAEALACAHERKIVHRDIKSKNLLLAQGEIVKVADFGLARVVEQKDSTITESIGSPLYMAPELIQGEPFDHRADLYSLGIVFYELVTGQPPFTEGLVTYHHVYTQPRPPRELRADLSPPLEKIILRLIEKHPDQRCASAYELLALLKRSSL